MRFSMSWCRSTGQKQPIQRTVWLAILGLVGWLGVVGSSTPTAMGQQQVATEPPTAIQPLYIPSPLAHLSNRELIPPAPLHDPLAMRVPASNQQVDLTQPAGPPVILQVRNVALGKTLAEHARRHQVSLEKAEEVLIQYLVNRLHLQPDANRGNVESLGDQRFRITGTAEQLAELGNALQAYEQCLPQVVVEMRFVTVDDERVGEIMKSVMPLRNGPQDLGTQAFMTPEAKEKAPAATYVRASHAMRRSHPASLGIVSDEALRSLLKSTKGDTRANITQAPTVMMYSGSEANVSDAAYRPFVVGGKVVDHQGTVQPIVQTLEEGMLTRIRATVDADQGHVLLQGELAQAQVERVDNAAYFPPGSQKQMLVQVPHHDVAQVEFALNLNDGETALVDPMFLYQSAVQTQRANWFRGAKFKNVQSRTLVLLTARLIEEPLFQ